MRLAGVREIGRRARARARAASRACRPARSPRTSSRRRRRARPSRRRSRRRRSGARASRPAPGRAARRAGSPPRRRARRSSRRGSRPTRGSCSRPTSARPRARAAWTWIGTPGKSRLPPQWSKCRCVLTTTATRLNDFLGSGCGVGATPRRARASSRSSRCRRGRARPDARPCGRSPATCRRRRRLRCRGGCRYRHD